MKRKIKDIYINRPWLAAFICPFVIFSISIIFYSTSIFYIATKNIDWLIIFTTIAMVIGCFVIPGVWLIVGLFISKRKLPYILSLTIGYGSLALVMFATLQIFPKTYVSNLPKCNSSPLVINFNNNDKEDFNTSEDAKKVKVLQQWNDCFGNFVLVNNEIPQGNATHFGEFKEGKLNGMGKIYFKNGTILEGKFTDGELIEEIKFIFD